MKSEAWTLLGCCMGTVRPSRRPSGQPPGRAPQDEVNLWWHKEKFLMLRRRPWAFLGRRLEARRLAIQRPSSPHCCSNETAPNRCLRHLTHKHVVYGKRVSVRVDHGGS